MRPHIFLPFHTLTLFAKTYALLTPCLCNLAVPLRFLIDGPAASSKKTFLWLLLCFCLRFLCSPLSPTTAFCSYSHRLWRFFFLLLCCTQLAVFLAVLLTAFTSLAMFLLSLSPPLPAFPLFLAALTGLATLFALLLAASPLATLSAIFHRYPTTAAPRLLPPAFTALTTILPLAALPFRLPSEKLAFPLFAPPYFRRQPRFGHLLPPQFKFAVTSSIPLPATHYAPNTYTLLRLCCRLL
jgi:hypothetical protein